MSEVTRILDAVAQGDAAAASQLLPLVYDELRRLAAAWLAREAAGQTLDATALVHEAYLRLVPESQRGENRAWAGRAHFFGAAAEAMRRILVEKARRKARRRHGGGRRRVELTDVAARTERLDEVLAVDEALDRLAVEDRQTAELVKLHYFAGLTIEEAAALLGVAPRTAYRNWAFARAWLFRHLGA